MKIHKPSAAMKIVTTCERIQPTCAGTDKNGELVWEGRKMPHWQMEMFKVAVNWLGEWFTRWYELSKYEKYDKEYDTAENAHFAYKAAPKAFINELKRMYPSKQRARQHSGD